MEFKIIFDSAEGEGKIYIYEEWTRGKGKNKQKKYMIIDEPIAEVEFVVGEKDLHVSSLDVDEKYRRKGLGRLIMNIIFALGVYFDRQVELVSGNEDASKFYRAIKMKAKKNEKDEFYWSPPKKRKHL